MNVILEASMLGTGLYHKKSQTGVSRVAEHLLTGLWHAPDINLSLAASTHLSETMRYAQNLLGNQGPSFVNRRTEQRQAMVENTLLNPFQVDSLPTKLIREAFYRTRKSLGIQQARFDTKQWPTNSIFHSPFYSIPEAVAQDRAVKSVQTIYDLIPIFHPEWFPNGDNTIQLMLEKLPPEAHVVTISEATKQDLCQYTGIQPARVTTIHLAATPSLFYPVTDQSELQAVRDQYKLTDSPYLLSLATLEPRKNIDHLIRCFVQAARSKDIPADIKLVLVGAVGWKIDKIMGELAQSEEMRARIIVTGFVPNSKLAALYSGALGFIYPSLYEGFGLPPLEAMQCGLPVIVSSIPSLEEVVGDAGLYVPPTDADALSETIVRLVNSASLRTEFAAKARQRAKLFSWETFIDEHVKLYRHILN